jgi:hypothetical protein
MTPAQRSGQLSKPCSTPCAVHLCLETRYLDAVEQERAKTSAFQYLNERWAFGPTRTSKPARWLILGKRPDDKKGKPRADLVPGGPRSRLLRKSRHCRLLEVA